MSLDHLETVIESIRQTLEAKNAARESLLTLSRTLTRHCANAIRAMHRQEWQPAVELLSTARATADQMRATGAAHPDLFYAGYTQDSLKELVEASALLAMLRGEPLPDAVAVGVEPATYVNGLAEAASELRRYILDILRNAHTDEAERLLADMDTIYSALITVDFPDAISGGLRHRTDSLRGVLEKTRGDMTTSLRQDRLQAALERLEKKLADST
jgi:translin